MGSNIHGLSEVRTNDNNTNSQHAWGRMRSREPLTGTGGWTAPKCIDLFLPGFTWRSSVLVISAIQIVIYIVTLAFGSSGLQPHGSVLSMFGSSYGPAIQKGEIWRLFMPIFLHASIWHILFNVFFQLRMAFPLERAYGSGTIAIIYFVCGVAGNLFSVAVAPCKYAVGASTAGFGLIGIEMAELAVNWHLLMDRDQAIFNIVLFAVVTMMMSVGPASYVAFGLDWRGHLGGFLAGFPCGLLLNREQESQPRWLKSSGSVLALSLLGALFISCPLVIFLIPMSGESGRCV